MQPVKQSGVPPRKVSRGTYGKALEGLPQGAPGDEAGRPDAEDAHPGARLGRQPAARLHTRPVAGRVGRGAGKTHPVRDESHPVLSVDAIREDPWNAVSLPLPENPSLQLLESAENGARDFIAAAQQDMPGKDQHQARAYAEESIFEAYQRIELLREERERLMDTPGAPPLDAKGQLTPEAVADNPWSAALFPLPPADGGNDRAPRPTGRALPARPSGAFRQHASDHGAAERGGHRT